MGSNQKHNTNMSESYEFVLLYFSTKWCPICKLLDPIFSDVKRSLLRDYPARISFAKIDHDTQPDIARHFKVRSVPSLKLLKMKPSADQSIHATSLVDLRQYETLEYLGERSETELFKFVQIQLDGPITLVDTVGVKLPKFSVLVNSNFKINASIIANFHTRCRHVLAVRRGAGHCWTSE